MRIALKLQIAFVGTTFYHIVSASPGTQVPLMKFILVCASVMWSVILPFFVQYFKTYLLQCQHDGHKLTFCLSHTYLVINFKSVTLVDILILVGCYLDSGLEKYHFRISWLLKLLMRDLMDSGICVMQMSWCFPLQFLIFVLCLLLLLIGFL